MKKLFLFLFFAGWVMALYEHQAGVFDWSIKNMGEIDSVYFWENNFYFSIKDDENSIGAASLLNGTLHLFLFFIYVFPNLKEILNM